VTGVVDSLAAALVERVRLERETPRRRITCAACAVLAFISLTARARAQAGTVVDVVAHEYAFTMRDTIPAGLTTFRLRDEGTEWHHVKLVRLDSGRTLAQMYDALGKGEPFPAWMHFLGGPNAPAPNQVVSVTVELEPGRYAIWCNVNAPDGKPHWTKGMFKQFIVTPSARNTPLPTGDLTVTLRDYAFDLSRPITRGAHAIRITNSASQPHEIFILRLKPRAGMDEVKAWLTKRLPKAPGEPFGGTTDIAPGDSLLLGASFPAGRYAFICWVADARDGQAHWRHGMIRVIDVR
jgi:hypothetical protein